MAVVLLLMLLESLSSMFCRCWCCCLAWLVKVCSPLLLLSLPSLVSLLPPPSSSSLLLLLLLLLCFLLVLLRLVFVGVAAVFVGSIVDADACQ